MIRIQFRCKYYTRCGGDSCERCQEKREQLQKDLDRLCAEHQRKRAIQRTISILK